MLIGQWCKLNKQVVACKRFFTNIWAHVKIQLVTGTPRQFEPSLVKAPRQGAFAGWYRVPFEVNRFAGLGGA